MQNTNLKRTALACALLLCGTLAACGGGDSGTGSASTSTGGTTAGGSTGGGTTTQPVTGTVSTPQYAAGSAQLGALNTLNQYRAQCGVPALQENTVLDQAAQNHAKYLGLNNTITDVETSGNPGYTGASYLDRAVAAGFPSNVVGVGVSGGAALTTSSFTGTQAGQVFVNSLLSGVYHVDVATVPVTTVGIGESETQTTSGTTAFTQAWQSMTLFNTQAQTLSSVPLTFPCQGVTGVPYRSVGEIPTPPNVSTSGWGTPVALIANQGDTVVLQSASITGPSGSVAVQILNSATDPNKELAAYQAVAYPTSPLQPSTQYTVSLTGTVNGTPFSRNFTFTTGS